MHKMEWTADDVRGYGQVSSCRRQPGTNQHQLSFPHAAKITMTCADLRSTYVVAAVKACLEASGVAHPCRSLLLFLEFLQKKVETALLHR